MPQLDRLIAEVAHQCWVQEFGSKLPRSAEGLSGRAIFPIDAVCPFDRLSQIDRDTAFQSVQIHSARSVLADMI